MRLPIVVALSLTIFCAPPICAADDTYVKLKRAALWVPDLDRAIVFFRDVLGFRLESQGTLIIEEGSVMFDLFNAEPPLTVRRALFSSSVENNSLFVMESKDAPTYDNGEERPSILVIETHDLPELLARAASLDFKVGESNVTQPASVDGALHETVVVGPGGQSVLIYQIVPEES